MKYLISLLVVCFGAGCAKHKELVPQSSVVVPGTNVSAKRFASVRTPEIVKAYSAGRYTDPNYPDEMHERHPVYRREQSPDWNYLPDPPPVLSNGNVSSSSGARHLVYAEALQEQNRAMQKRIEELQRQTGQVPELRQKIDQLEKHIDQTPKPEPTREPVREAATEDDLFSTAEQELPDWGTQPDDQNFLFSQMRLNDKYAAELAIVERRKISAVIYGPFQRRKAFALLTP